MKLPLTLVALLVFSTPQLVQARYAKRDHSTHDYYVLEHDPLAGASLDDVLNEFGLELVEQVGQLQNHWLLRRPLQNVEDGADNVLQKFKTLRRSTVRRRDDLHPLTRSIRHLSRQELRQRVKRAPPPITPSDEEDEDSISSSEAVAKRLGIADPEFPSQWHLVNNDFPVHMINVTPVWEEGITGKGILSALVDDGLDFESDDLAANFDAENSYDFNDHVDLPKPMLFDDHHGTRCAGQIAAVKNDVCGVGIAYGSKVSGIRILSGPISDVDEAAALNYGYQNTSIYSCSWGPPDDGRSMEGPSYLIEKAVLNGVQNGRGGKGSVFVFASGNGASQGDQCNFDGYTNSIYSVTISAVDYKGLHPYYSEPCAANMVVTYSSGSGKNIVTTDVGKNKCSHSHGGTSAAAPNAVGIFALALSVRPELTWRDIQHLCVNFAKLINADDPDWEPTAVGRPYSYKYGYGRLDAHAYVKAAQEWTLVKPQAWIDMPIVQLQDGLMTNEGEMSGGEPIIEEGVRSSLTLSEHKITEHNFEKLEHITVTVWISHSLRGDVEVELQSPNGVKSILAARRKFDNSGHGFRGWRFMTVKHWDENPVGDWSIRVSDQNNEDESGRFLGWTMTFWGSTVDASKAKKLELVDRDDAPFPPPEPSEDDDDDDDEDDDEASTASLVATATRIPTKPTAHLPGDHGTAEGEADTPAFSSAAKDASASNPTATSTPAEQPSAEETFTPDEGWFSDLSKLMNSQKWFFGAIGAVVLFGLSAAGFFIWRRRKFSRREYTSLRGEEMPMGTIGHDSRFTDAGPGRTKELYDAFGEVSDDEDEDADENTRLRAGQSGEGGLGYHSGFLEDDGSRPASPAVPLYKDEPAVTSERAPESRGEIVERKEADGEPRSPASGSGDGSWEHASDTR